MNCTTFSSGSLSRKLWMVIRSNVHSDSSTSCLSTSGIFETRSSSVNRVVFSPRSLITSRAISFHQSPLYAEEPTLLTANSRQFRTGATVGLFKSFSGNNDAKNAESSSTQEAAEPSHSNDSSAKAEENPFAREVEDLRKEKDELLDKYRRSIAENDNMRKRLSKQIEDAKIFGIQGFCKDLLEVADVLSKAVDAAAHGNEQKDKMVEGLELTQNQMHQVFRRHGLIQISPVVGEEKFDPTIHEALFQVPAPDKEANIVMNVQKIGYLLHGRTLRPALVGVSKK